MVGPETKEKDHRNCVKFDSDQKVVKIISGHVQILRKKKIVGYCHSSIHPGALTRELFEEHGCLEKKCHWFEKNEKASYWSYLDQVSRRKEKIQKRKIREKEEQNAKASALEEVRDILQGYIDDAGYNMEIIRVERLRKDVYKVFYVSENPFADGNRFPAFLEMVKENSPKWRIHLQHIKGVDGRFVTCDEYRAIKKRL